MQIHTYQGKYEVEYSIVNLSELEGALRIDAEYYDPVYVRNENMIKNKKWKFLDDFIVTLTDGKHGGVAFTENGVLLIRNQNNREGYIDLSNLRFISEKESEETIRAELETDDVLLTTIGTVGFSSVVPTNFPRATINQNLVRIHLKNLNPYYLSTFFNSRRGRLMIYRLVGGNIQAIINYPNLKLLKIPIPSDKSQKRIEHVVLQSQQERENAEHLYKEAEDILLNELSLKGWNPKTKKIVLDDIEFEEEKNISIKKLSDVLEVNRLDAEYWDQKYDELEDLIKDYEMGGDYLANLIYISKEKIKPENDEIYNYIELADINSNLGSVNQTQEIKGSDLPSRARMDIREGDILMSSVEGSIDKIALIDFEKNNLVASTGFFIFRENKLNKETILVLLNIFSERYIKRQAQGTILTAIPYDSLNRVILPIVDPKIQSIIAQRIQQSFESRRKSKELLEIAKRSVEVYIEKDEEEGSRYINEELQKMETN